MRATTETEDSFRVLSIVRSPLEAGNHAASVPQLVLGWRRDRGEEAPDVVRLRLDGELDAYSAATVGEACDRFLDGFDRVRIDLQAVSFIDAAGTRFLQERCARIERRGGECRLCNPSRVVRRLFAILGLEALITPESQRRDGAPTAEDAR